jgi:hypothetical protein
MAWRIIPNPRARTRGTTWPGGPHGLDGYCAGRAGCGRYTTRTGPQGRRPGRTSLSVGAGDLGICPDLADLRSLVRIVDLCCALLSGQNPAMPPGAILTLKRQLTAASPRAAGLSILTVPVHADCHSVSRSSAGGLTLPKRRHPSFSDQRNPSPHSIHMLIAQT